MMADGGVGVGVRGETPEAVRASPLPVELLPAESWGHTLSLGVLSLLVCGQPLCASACTYMSMCVSTCRHMCVLVCVHIHVCVNMSTHANACMGMGVYMHLSVSMCAKV